MSERIGPKVFHAPGRTLPVLTCIGCTHLKSDLIKPGKEPQYEYSCLNPNHKDVYSHGFIAFEGYPTETPNWCPELKANRLNHD